MKLIIITLLIAYTMCQVPANPLDQCLTDVRDSMHLVLKSTTRFMTNDAVEGVKQM